jgi:hypothetical protein
VLPLSDGIPARRFPIVNIAIIVANFAVWLFDGGGSARRKPALTRSSLSA